MISSIQRLGRSIGNFRNRQISEDGNDDRVYSRPQIRIVDRTQVESSTSRWLVSIPFKRPSKVLSNEPPTSDTVTKTGPNNAYNTATESNDNDGTTTDLPLLYSLARSWAWEAVSFRCTSHPNEVDAKYCDYRGDTILHWVAFGRPPHETVHEILLKCPTLARIPNHSGTLPLHVACSYRASSMVIQEILNAYPEAVATPDSNGATPMHYLCDYGSGTGRETIASMKVLLRCYSYGIQSVIMTDRRYHRRPIFILNARKNIREQEQYIETIRSRRFRQRAIRKELAASNDWNHQLKYELLDQLEDDISTIYRDNDFWKLVSLLIVAEHLSAFPSRNKFEVTIILNRFFGNSIDNEDSSQVREIFGFDEDEEKSMILHAFVNNTDCPQSLLEYAILLYEPYLLRPDPLSTFTTCDHSTVPLHVAASMYINVVATTGSTDRMSHLLSLLVDGCPIAASIRDRNGRLPFGLLLQQQQQQQGISENPNRVHWSNGMQAMIDAYPSALLDDDVDLFTHQQQALWPQMLSLIGRNRNTIYCMFRTDPTLLLKSTRTMSSSEANVCSN